MCIDSDVVPTVSLLVCGETTVFISDGREERSIIFVEV